MSEINVDGCRIHAEVEGPERAPVLVLSNSLATTLHMWDPQVSAITQHFRLVRYDPRGHGLSDVPAGPYTMERLGRDALAILDSLGINKVSWCGLSMGGMVGQWLGANAPERIERLMLSNTSSYFADWEAGSGDSFGSKRIYQQPHSRRQAHRPRCCASLQRRAAAGLCQCCAEFSARPLVGAPPSACADEIIE
jgi:pimeloyl-ACP methyl ester carboxylesterase